jgi:small conductance mechanosensitive channel
MQNLLNNLFDLLLSYYRVFLEKLPALFIAAVILALAYVLGGILKRIYVNRFSNRFKDSLAAKLVGQVLRWVFVFVGLFISFHVLGFSGIASKIIAGAGLTAIIVGFAFRDIAENFLSGILLAGSRPFNIGNTIESAGLRGKVRGLSLRYTHIRTADGKDIYIPNATIVKNPLIKFAGDGLIRIDSQISFHSTENINKIVLIIRGILENQKEVLKLPPPQVHFDAIEANTYNIKFFAWINVRKTPVSPASLKSILLKDIAKSLKEKNIDLPGFLMKNQTSKT